MLLALRDQIGPLDSDSSARFCRFAKASGARFDPPGSADDSLSGLGTLPIVTALEAVLDSDGRLLALWLRTPEPLDWRRVNAALVIHHVKQKGTCPTAYAQRQPLSLAILVMPSPDGSSAILIGALAGFSMRLPRGEYRLHLTFDPRANGLPPLRPGAAIVGARQSKCNLHSL